MDYPSFIATENDAGVRLDKFLVERTQKTRSSIQKLVSQGSILHNGAVVKKAGATVNFGDIIQIMKAEEREEAAPAPLPMIAVIAETADYVVIQKPAGVLVHATDAGETGTVADWAVATYPDMANVGDDPGRPGIVHRLDKEASGVLLLARTPAMFAHVKQQFQARTILKEYVVLVHGLVSSDHETITFPIDRGADGRMAARPHVDKFRLKNVGKEQPGKEAVTEFFVEERFARFTLLRVHIHTGRTHQIRVHMFAYGHPVVGDTIYMNAKLNLKRDMALGRLFLHARKLCFADREGQRQCYEAELPPALAEFLGSLR